MRRALVLLLLLGACSRAGGDTVEVRFETSRGRLTFVAEVADEPAEQARGLMGRESMPEDRGMLFIWAGVSARSFYMKNTLIPLDLIAIRSGRVVSISTMQPCTADPCPTTATAPADSALEINAGQARARGITVGTLVSAPGLP